MNVFEHLQLKMADFLPNFLGDKIFRKLNVSADFRANWPTFIGNCVFYLK